MVVKARRYFILFIIAISSPFVLLKDARALVPIDQIKMLMDMLYDVYANIDPQVAYDLSRVRNDLPKIIQGQTISMQPQMTKYNDEMEANFADHKAKTGSDAVSLIPNTQQLLQLIQTLVNHTFDASFKQGLASGYSDYAAKLTEVSNSIAAPTDGSTPPAPPTDVLSGAIPYFQNQAAQARANAGRFAGITVNGASNPIDLQRNIEAAQGRIAGLLNGNKFNDGAAQGLINALSRMKERAIAMQQRPDHENDIYDQEEADGLVNMANNLIQSSAKASLEEVATFTDSIVSGLQRALDSIVNPVETEVPGETARTIVADLSQQAATRAANAQSAANSAAAAINSDLAAVNSYWTNQLYATRIHCHWEEKMGDALQPLYAMYDEYNNLNQPEAFLIAANSALWTQLKSEILRISGLLKASMEKENAEVSKSAAANFSIPQLPPIAGAPHFRFTGQCGVYTEDPASKAARAASPATLTASVATISATARRAARDVKRTSKAKSKPKKPKKNSIAPGKFKQNVNRSVKKFKSNLPAHMNETYKTLYKVYPPVPFSRK